jgi:fatty-acyl-CoA synthase
MGEWYENQTIGLLPERAARRWGSREALVFQGRRWTFAELHAGVDAAAKGLIQLGIGPGDKVALWLVNGPEWLHAMFAIMQIGAILVPVNTRFRTDDMAYVLSQSDAVAVMLAARSGPVDYLGMMRDVAPGLGRRPDPRFPALRHVIALSDQPPAEVTGWRQMLEDGRRVDDHERHARAQAVDPRQSAFFLYTSGTTGFPKGAVHSHGIVRNVSDMADRMGVTAADVILMYLPLFHIFGFVCGALMSIITGARQVLTETFDGNECVDLIASERATLIHGFDTHFKDLLDAQQQKPRDVSSVRTGICGTGMSSAVPTARRARHAFGHLMTAFGMSETGVVTQSMLDSTEEQCVEANGSALPGHEVRIVDPATGADPPVSVPGEILVRSYMVTRGYYNKPEETKRAIDGDGWFHTGDMGVLRADGHLRFLGRYKDMLKVGGENVDPMEVEEFPMTSTGKIQKVKLRERARNEWPEEREA